MKNEANERMFKVILKAVQNGLEVSKYEEINGVFDQAVEFITNQEIDAIEEECEVTSHGSSQNVRFGDFVSTGQIVDFSANCDKSPDTKIFHSDFVNDDGCLVKLYYLVGETDYNAPEGYYYSRKAGKHLPLNDK